MHDAKMHLIFFNKTTKQNNSQKENKHNINNTVKHINSQKYGRASLDIGNYTKLMQLDSLKNNI